MSLFSLQKIRCQICGVEFETDFNCRGGYGANKECCGKPCHDELKWRRILAIMGKPYHPKEAEEAK